LPQFSFLFLFFTTPRPGPRRQHLVSAVHA
jgi:hypothetical protein